MIIRRGTTEFLVFAKSLWEIKTATPTVRTEVRLLENITPSFQLKNLEDPYHLVIQLAILKTIFLTEILPPEQKKFSEPSYILDAQKYENVEKRRTVKVSM